MDKNASICKTCLQSSDATYDLVHIRTINAELLAALEYLIQGRPGEAQFDRLYDVRVNAAHAAITKAEAAK